MFRIYRQNKGMTLIELMVAMAISGIVMAGVYSAYDSQAKSYNTQRLAVEMQENLRAALELLQMDLRLAGSDPSGDADAGFLTATPTSVSFTMDATGGEDDGIDNNDNNLVDEGENGIDDDGDGLVDEADEQEWYDGDTDDANESITWSLAGTTLQRNNGDVAYNIEVLNLVYLDADRIQIPDAQLASRLEDIKTVQVTLIGRAGSVLAPMTFKTPDQTIYRNQQNITILDKSGVNQDNFRRRLISSEVNCRNIN